MRAKTKIQPAAPSAKTPKLPPNAVKHSAIVLRHLQELFPEPEISLQYRNAFSFLVAVLLSAQCRDERVNQVTPALFARADSAEKMRELSLEELEDRIRPCGLFRHKARFLKQLAEVVVSRYGGELPSSLEELEGLPGVGHKSAAVVASQFFGKNAFPVDTHIHRCAKRWGLSEGKNVRQTERDLCSLYPEPLWRTLHLQIILYARRYCPARGHRLEYCPVCRELRT
ncbi:MAG: endonuclease III [Puniceicoccales bacterium]|jgi:endonuclease-3|nr:endonuclease III [Puniceicoccales bacterium]